MPGDMAALLREQAFFARLPPVCREALQAQMHIQRAEPGTLIVREGSPGMVVYLILRGTASVLSEASEVELVRLHRGAFFGEIAAFYQVPRTATVRAHSSLTLASLHRDAILPLVRAHPDAFQPLIQEAQARYCKTRPIPPLVSHKALPHYQLSQIRLAFPAWAHIEDEQVARLIGSARLLTATTGQIVAFFGQNTAVLVLKGLLQHQDPLGALDPAKTYAAGNVASFKDCPGASPLAHMLAATPDTTAIVVSATELEALLAGKSLAAPSPQPFDEPTCQPAVPLLERAAEAPPPAADPTGRRRHSVEAIFWHEQAIHHPLAPPNVLEIPLESLHLESLPTVAALHSILLRHNIKTPDPCRLLPVPGTVDLTSLDCHLTDALMSDLATLLGPTWETLRLTGVSLSPIGLKAIEQHGARLRCLHLGDCVLLSSSALEALLSSCRRLVSLAIVNCPAVTDQLLATFCLAAPPLRDLELSYCRNLGIGGWRAISQLAPTLETLKLRRIMALGEEAILGEDTDGRRDLLFPHLRALDLSECAFLTSGALRAILAGMPCLEDLRLSFCTGLDETLSKALSYVEDAPLRHLDLSYCTRPLTDRSMETIVTCIPRLETFVARGARHATIKTLHSLLGLKSLRTVTMDATAGITAEDLQTVARTGNWTLPGCQ